MAAVTTIKLSVVGHTNVGKTSLLRTLLRDTSFGEVQAGPSTTRHVEGRQVQLSPALALELYDTPGLEDSMALLASLEQHQGGQHGYNLERNSSQVLQRFLDSSIAEQRFSQEAKVFRQALQSDALVVVIDAREPVQPKLVDELVLLNLCRRPMIAVLNFTGPQHALAQHDDQQAAMGEVSEGGAQAWRNALQQHGIYVVIDFDSVMPPLDGADQLFISLRSVLPQSYQSAVAGFLEDARRQRQRQQRQGCALLADMLLDVAAARVTCADSPAAIKQGMDELADHARQREAALVTALLQCFGFPSDSAELYELPLSEGRFERDLFHPDALKEAGISTATWGASGASVGAAIDVFALGSTLGAGTILGGAIGSGWQLTKRYGKRLKASWRGEQELSLPDAVINLLAQRGWQLLRALQHRGHADTSRLSYQPQAAAPLPWPTNELPDELKRARSASSWSILNANYDAQQSRREHALQRLTEKFFNAH